ncbi:hypothetical protein HDU92_004580 [Lobulomyces angularis]|nr:hypothetical protein HDU92_004580 [Lobulomyces angularis]
MTEKARVIKNGGTARGYGFITVLDDILAEKAVLDLNGTTIPGGNIITVEISHTPPKNSKKNKLKGINEEKENLTLLINGQKND